MKRDASDAAFSKLIRTRANWTCESCGTAYGPGAQGLHCSHLFGRRSRATRWHSLNAFAHCFACHQYLGSNPVIFAEWAIEKLGREVVDRVRYLHGLTIKLSKRDLLDVRRDLQAQVKEQDRGEAFETPATVLLAIQEAESRVIEAAGRVA